eukprot:TRINITY_DN54991_c0_g1_i3.p1 TRINITY_DN54991_c0_g1~~TRINITY_DN54991_c0_g1_i3.p1  ORF type:complete len:287 (+),score=66.22 TRINITY_DN54991_c0_g1_i3:68-928(+)
MIRRPPRSTLSSSSAASDVYKRQISSGTWSTDMVPEFMVSASAALAEYRRVSIDDRSDWGKSQHNDRPYLDASSTQQDLTSTGGRSSQGTSSAPANSDMGWSHHDSANIVVAPSPTKRRGSSNNSSLGGGNPLDDDTDTAHHEQQLPTGSTGKVHFLVSEGEKEDRLLRLDPISTTCDSPTQESSNPLEYSSPKTALDVSGPSIDVPDVSGSSWSEEHWCGPVQKDYTLPKMAVTATPPSMTDILDRSDHDDDAVDDNSCNASGVVEVPMMRSSSLSPSRLSPRRH